MPENVYSGFNTPENKMISLKDKLTEMNKDLMEYKEAIDNNEKIEDIYTGTDGFPRFLYMAIANSGWKRMAKANGINPKELYRKL